MVVRRIRIGAGIEQKADQRRGIAVRRPVQRRRPVAVPRRDVDAVDKQRPDRLVIGAARRGNELEAVGCRLGA